MKYYRVYTENDGKNRRGAGQGFPPEPKETESIWFSPESDYLIAVYTDGKGRKNAEAATACKLRGDDKTNKIKFFPGKPEVKEFEDIFSTEEKKPTKKKKTAKKVVKEIKE